jgi:hypothetical protein
VLKVPLVHFTAAAAEFVLEIEFEGFSSAVWFEFELFLDCKVAEEEKETC